MDPLRTTSVSPFSNVVTSEALYSSAVRAPLQHYRLP